MRTSGYPNLLGLPGGIKSLVHHRDCSAYRFAWPLQAVTQSNKRQGPLPLFLGQLLVLLAYGGLGFLAFKKDEETRKAVAIVLGLARKGYNKVQGLLPSGSKS